MADSPLIDRLRSRAESISDTHILQIVLAFIAGGLFVSVVAATLGAVGEVAAHAGRWEWLIPVGAAFRWLDGFSQNFSTEMIGAAITFILLEILQAHRRDKEAEVRETKRLILQMQSPFNESAVEAARQLRARGSLQDDSLHGAYLLRADLQKANLRNADLQGANLRNADLQGARLRTANLRGADLSGANLRGAFYIRVDQLQQAKSLYGTTLPDGTRLPADDTWYEVFNTWRETVEVNEHGHIVPATPDYSTGLPL